MSTPARPARPALLVHRVGGPAYVEDTGRPGQAGIGVGRSGAADRAAHALANRLLGNAPGAAALEVTLGGLELEVTGAPGAVVWLCLTGAPAPLVVAGREVGPGALVAARTGDRVAVGTPTRGLRSYLAVRGGIDVPAVLGSRSHDVLAGIGPAPLRPGTVLPVGDEVAGQPVVDGVPPAPGSDPGDVVLRVVRGPRDDWVADAGVLTTGAWRASSRTDRVGMRLERGEPGTEAPAGLLRAADHDASLPSEGATRGALQVPPSGEPVLFLADHPVTGGYPVVGVVVDADVDRAAQVRPGETVRFRWVRAGTDETGGS
ncbi:biotin-dependent carboxyltransferase family protein [Nocardioides sp. ChNu-153]|uniref:5-oxoprolinase subunit C family protein n=1 Tax=Nocardioides sp. ChNu-153 TaxID=2779364 RepID=UPI0026548FB9|nr:biotin-dependent carboxyltransferase family protein [Nocardioides sp. ChNu-153]MDN7120665.1 biotin-dependent carboxyltransferase family protein [Nocardioides sp. ChNu-153]